MDVGLLDDGGQRLLRHSTRLKEAREVAASAKARNAQFNRSSSSLPIALTVAVALRQSVLGLLAPFGTRAAADLQFHQALGGEADHFSQHIGVGALLHESRRRIIMSVIGGSSVGLVFATPTIPKRRR